MRTLWLVVGTHEQSLLRAGGVVRSMGRAGERAGELSGSGMGVGEGLQGNLASGAFGVGWLLLGAAEAVKEDNQRQKVANHQLKAN